jgi:hypothetical protein
LSPLWAPHRRTWYDSFQFKVTKRYSPGLILDYAFTWSKEEQFGVETAIPPATAINDYQNRILNKSISGFSRPFVSVISANYILPKWGTNKFVSQAIRDWTIGAVLSYGSGLPIPTPTSTNNLSTLLFCSTLFNRVPGVPLFLKDLNCHCIDPTKDLVLNPAAWSNPIDGQWGTSALFYNDFRYERRPAESLSFGRIFRFKESIVLTIRMNSQNIFNLTQLWNPTATNPLAPTTCTGGTGAVCANPATAGKLIGGFGFVNYVGGSTFLAPGKARSKCGYGKPDFSGMYGWVTRDNCGAKCTDTQVPHEFINIAASLKNPLPYRPWAAELNYKRIFMSRTA